MNLAQPDLATRTAILSVAVAREMERRKRVGNYESLPRRKSSPFADLWKPVHTIVLYGGRGAAKDWSVADVLVQKAKTEEFTDAVILCTREYQNSISDSVHRVLRRMIYRLGLENEFHITDKTIRCRATNCEFIFKGLHHNVEEVKSTEAVKLTWVAEAQNTTEESWINLEPTIFREPGSQLIVSFNVTDENSATHRRFVTNPPKGAIVHKVNYTENPFFPPGLRRLMEKDRANDTNLYNHIWLGFPRKQSNAVILADRCRIEEFPDDLWKKAERPMFGADFGYASDPNTLVRLFALPNKKARELGLIAKNDPFPDLDRLYIEYEAGGVGIELDEMPELYDSIPGSREWPIKADSARPETISHLRRKGFNISAAEKWKGCIEDGIAHYRSHVVIIHPRCVQFANEATYAYRYKVDPKTIDPNTNAPVILPIILDANNHYIDGGRYAMDGYIQRRGTLATWAKLGKKR